MNQSIKTNIESALTTDNHPDPSWRGLYIAGGISAIMYVVLALIVPGAMIAVPKYDLTLSGRPLLSLIAEHKTWWMLLQALVLETSILLIVTTGALFAVLKHHSKSISAIAAMVLGTSQILFMAYYPVLLGLTSLSNQFSAAEGAQQEIFVTAAEGLIAQNNAFNPVYECLFGAGIMLFSLVMLKGAFPKGVAYVGIAGFAAVIAGMSLFPVIGLGYFLWWIFPMIWLVSVGWSLLKIGASIPR